MTLPETLHYAQQMLQSAADVGIRVRLAGSAAIALRCQPFQVGRIFTGWQPQDIDLVCDWRDATLLQNFLNRDGFKNDSRLQIATEGRRSVMYSPTRSYSIDVFFDRMEFCHTVELRERLCLDPATLTLADLLLSKLQYIEPRPSDIDDIAILFEIATLGEQDNNFINTNRVNSVLANSWGFYQTATLNLDRVETYLTHEVNGKSSKAVFRLRELRQSISDSPKSLRWRIRACFGTRWKWYNDVEPLNEPF